MLNEKLTKNKVEKLYHLCCIMNKFAQSIYKENGTEEEERMTVLTEYIADIADDLYYDFIKQKS